MKTLHTLAFVYIIIVVNSLILPTHAQRAFSIGTTGGESFLIEIDLQTCEICVISEALIPPGGADLTMLPNGTFVRISSITLSLFSAPPTSTLLFSNTPSPNGFRGSTYDVINDVVYVTGNNGLYTFDYITYTLTFIGAWPAGWINPGELIFFTNGQLYGIGTTTNPGSFDLYEIDINNPSNSTVLYSIGNLGLGLNGLGSSEDGFYYTSGAIGEFNISSQTWVELCPFNPAFTIGTISVPTFTVPDYECIPICLTRAGTIIDQGPIVDCVSEVITVPTAIGVELYDDDLLQYALFSDLTDTLGTIIATSNTPDFAFDPAIMATGVTYYVVTIAGADDGTGNVDFDDECFSLGLRVQPVQWQPEPTVTFSAVSADICENGCKEINASFTGNPPFILTYQVGNDPEISQTFNTANGNFEICIGAETGTIDLKATDLSDAVCCGS